MKVGSLFSGIGGFDLAFARCGFEIAWQCEIDKHASKVLSRPWPDTRNIGDVKDVRSTDGPIDVLVGGFPCQDLSVAGKRAGLDGERSGLFFEFARCIEALAPEWVVIENVPGLLSSNSGRDMATVLGTLGELGYGWAYRVLDAQYFGVPQRRRRVFIVGCSGGRTRRAAEVLFEPESVCGDTPPRRETRQDVAGTLGGSSQSGGFRTTDLDNNGAFVIKGAAIGRKPEAGPQYGEVLSDGTCYTLQTNEVHAVYVIQDGREIEKQQNGLGISEDGVAYTINGTGAQAVAFAQNQRGELRTSAIAAQLTAGGGKPGQGYPAVASLGVVRRLTPRECEKLQGFPCDWTATGQADSHRYKQLGNAVAVPVVEWIARRIAVTR